MKYQNIRETDQDVNNINRWPKQPKAAQEGRGGKTIKIKRKHLLNLQAHTIKDFLIKYYAA